MNNVHCPICHQPVEPEKDRKEHLETHRLDDQNMKEIVLHIMKLEDRVIALEKSKGYEGNE